MNWDLYVDPNGVCRLVVVLLWCEKHHNMNTLPTISIIIIEAEGSLTQKKRKQENENKFNEFEEVCPREYPFYLQPNEKSAVAKATTNTLGMLSFLERCMDQAMKTITRPFRTIMEMPSMNADAVKYGSCT